MSCLESEQNRIALFIKDNFNVCRNAQDLYLEYAVLKQDESKFVKKSIEKVSNIDFDVIANLLKNDITTELEPLSYSLLKSVRRSLEYLSVFDEKLNKFLEKNSSIYYTILYFEFLNRIKKTIISDLGEKYTLILNLILQIQKINGVLDKKHEKDSQSLNRSGMIHNALGGGLVTGLISLGIRGAAQYYADQKIYTSAEPAVQKFYKLLEFIYHNIDEEKGRFVTLCHELYKNSINSIRQNLNNMPIDQLESICRDKLSQIRDGEAENVLNLLVTTGALDITEAQKTAILNSVRNSIGIDFDREKILRVINGYLTSQKLSHILSEIQKLNIEGMGLQGINLSTNSVQNFIKQIKSNKSTNEEIDIKDVLLLYDDELTGVGKKGFLITNHFTYHHNPSFFGGNNFFKISNKMITNISDNGSQLNFYLSGTQYEAKYSRKKSSKELIKLLKNLYECLSYLPSASEDFADSQNMEKEVDILRSSLEQQFSNITEKVMVDKRGATITYLQAIS